MAKIIGNTTATPYPRPDWNQTDEAKADFIKNKPDIGPTVDKLNSLYYYGDSNIVPSDASLFAFETDDITMTASVKFNGERNEDNEFVYEGILVIPYECVVDGKTYRVTIIENLGFAYCRRMTSIAIPNSVIYIGANVFEGCFNLANITLPDSVKSIGNQAFKNCSSLTSITIPKNVTDIRYNTFQYCSSLTNLIIPDSVTNIGNFAFCGCTRLTNITIPDSVTSIGDRAFGDCSSLTSVTLPNSVTSIATGVFSNCSSLKSVTIPYCVTYISSGAFEHCSELTDVYFKGTQEQWIEIDIASENDELYYATIHYEHISTTKGYVDKEIASLQNSGGFATIVDQIYDPTSENAQSGKAVAEAIANLNGGLSSETLNINFTVTEFNSSQKPIKLTSDKNAQEILAAITEGKSISALCNLGANLYAKPQFSRYFDSIMFFTFDIGNIKYNAISDINDLEGTWAVNASTYIMVDDTDNFIDIEGHRISNLLDPVQSQDAVTKSYHDSECIVLSNEIQYCMENIEQNSEKISELKPTPITSFDTGSDIYQLECNQSYHLSEVPNGMISFPSPEICSTDGDVIYLSFIVGDTLPEGLAFNITDTSDIDIEFSPNTGYEIYGKYNAGLKKWIIGYSEFTVTDGETI